MTKRNPNIYRNYGQKRPQYPFRLPADNATTVERVRLELNMSKQSFMKQVFELGYPLLLQRLSNNS